MPYSKEQKREYDKRYRELNKEKKSEQNRKWNEENKEKKAEYNKKWREENKEERAKYGKKWREENREHTIEYKREKRKRCRSKCVEYLGGKCVKCGTTHNLQFDHIDRIPKKYTIASRVTNNFTILKEELDKCQLLCAPCHLQKTAKEWTDITHNTVPLSKLDTMP